MKVNIYLKAYLHNLIPSFTDLVGQPVDDDTRILPPPPHRDVITWVALSVRRR